MKKVFSIEKYIEDCEKSGCANPRERIEKEGSWARLCEGKTAREAKEKYNCLLSPEWLVEIDEPDEYEITEKIKTFGLETYLRDNIKTEEAKTVLSALFETAFDKLTNDEYLKMVFEVIDKIKITED